jgi:hypothetical protein
VSSPSAPVPDERNRPLDCPPGDAEVLAYRADLAGVRGFAASWGHRAGLAPGRVRDLLVVAGELTANTEPIPRARECCGCGSAAARSFARLTMTVRSPTRRRECSGLIRLPTMAAADCGWSASCATGWRQGPGQRARQCAGTCGPTVATRTASSHIWRRSSPSGSGCAEREQQLGGVPRTGWRSHGRHLNTGLERD